MRLLLECTVLILLIYLKLNLNSMKHPKSGMKGSKYTVKFEPNGLTLCQETGDGVRRNVTARISEILSHVYMLMLAHLTSIVCVCHCVF